MLCRSKEGKDDGASRSKVPRTDPLEKESSQPGSKGDKSGTSKSKVLAHHTPEKELAFVVLQAGQMDDVRYLTDYLQMTKLSGELNVNEADSKGCTALQFAVASKKIEIVKTLVEYGANVNQRDLSGFTALFWATGRYADVQIASYLIEKCRASVHITTQTNACALHGAALQGNADCVALLLKHGADAHCMDKNMKTPLDLAKDEATRTLLYQAQAQADLEADKSDGSCAQCGKAEDVTLKRCGRCFVTRYCGRDCQLSHWNAGHRKTCPGFVTARVDMTGLASSGLRCTLNTQNAENVKMTVHEAGSTADCQPAALKKTKFIVKVQVPVAPNYEAVKGLDMMVYNQDRSVTGFISNTEKGYESLHTLIRKEGFRSIKAFFWAELCNNDNNGGDVKGSFKVFHGKCAPYQSW